MESLAQVSRKFVISGNFVINLMVDRWPDLRELSGEKITRESFTPSHLAGDHLPGNR